MKIKMLLIKSSFVCIWSCVKNSSCFLSNWIFIKILIVNTGVDIQTGINLTGVLFKKNIVDQWSGFCNLYYCCFVYLLLVNLKVIFYLNTSKISFFKVRI